MEQIHRFHEYLLQERTHIQNHKQVLLWMKQCWKIAPRADPSRVTTAEYIELYSILFCEMAICWEEELSDTILQKMCRRDTSQFSDLNFGRFCCSLFFFVEMWVEAVTLEEYERIFRHIHLLLSGKAPAISMTNPTTLASFNSALDSILDLEESNLNIGKSINFGARKYFLQFGAEDMPQYFGQPEFLPVRRKSVATGTLSLPSSPCFTKRYHDNEHGDKLCKSSPDQAKREMFEDLRHSASSGGTARHGFSRPHTWRIHSQRNAQIVTKAELKCCLSPLSNRIVTRGDTIFKSFLQQPEVNNRSRKYRLHVDKN